MSSGGGGSTETVQSSEPWIGVQNYLGEVFRNAKGLYRDPAGQINPIAMTPEQRLAELQAITGGPADPAAYADYLTGLGMPGEAVTAGAQLGVTPFTPYELQAQQGLADYATGGRPPILDAASGELEAVLGGRYLTEGNPYLEGVYRAASRPVIEDFNTEILPAISAQFATSGRAGSGLHGNVVGAAADDLTRNLADMSSRLYGSNYEAERGRMMAGLGMAPGVAQLERGIDIGNLGLLGDVGAAQRDLAGQMAGLPGIANMEPWQRLSLYSDMLGQGSGFSTVTASQPYYRNRLAGSLGGGASGAGLGMMAGGPIGAAVGGGLGLLGGYFA